METGWPQPEVAMGRGSASLLPSREKPEESPSHQLCSSSRPFTESVLSLIPSPPSLLAIASWWGVCGGVLSASNAPLPVLLPPTARVIFLKHDSCPAYLLQ